VQSALEQPVKRAKQVQRAKPAKLAQQDTQAQRAKRAKRANKVPREIRVQQAEPEQRVQQVRPEQQATPETLDYKAPRDHPEVLDIRDQQVEWAQLAPPAPPVLRDTLVGRVQQDILVLQVPLVLRERPV
jgi:hypothetical protein